MPGNKYIYNFLTTKTNNLMANENFSFINLRLASYYILLLGGINWKPTYRKLIGLKKMNHTVHIAK